MYKISSDFKNVYKAMSMIVSIPTRNLPDFKQTIKSSTHESFLNMKTIILTVLCIGLALAEESGLRVTKKFEIVKYDKETSEPVKGLISGAKQCGKFKMNCFNNYSWE